MSPMGDKNSIPCVTSTDLGGSDSGLKLLARGKVRDIYEVDATSLLFVATDRLSAFDVVMNNGIPGKGKILTQLSVFWFAQLQSLLPNHLITDNMDEMPPAVQAHRHVLQGRALLVRRLKVLPVEAIVRGYITGSGWVEYCQKGTICDIPLPAGLQESQKLAKPLFTPSTKAEIGGHDENIHPDKVAALVGKELAQQMEQKAIELYTKASEFARERGILIADTKFEFGVDENGTLYLVDEVLTPDSSRFWPADLYEPGRGQQSFDKQFVRDYLKSIQFNKKDPVTLPETVVQKTMEKYVQVYKILTGKEPTL